MNGVSIELGAQVGADLDLARVDVVALQMSEEAVGGERGVAATC